MKPTMNTYYQRPILTLFYLIFVFSCGFAQDTEQCFDLEELYPDSTLVIGKATNTPSGEIIFSESSFTISLDSFLYNDGSKGYENIYLTNDFFGDLLDNAVLAVPSNINARFEFISAKEKLTKACFDFYDGGGEVNIAINGSPILNLNNLLELQQFDESPFGDEVSVSVEGFSGTDFPSGQLCISGNITSLLIGGQEMGINNICYETEERDDEDDDDCPIEEVKVQITKCTDEGGYDLLVDLHLTMDDDDDDDDDDDYHQRDSFQLIIEGTNYGSFAYNDLPVQLSNVLIFTDALHFEVAACDKKKANCCVSTFVDKSDCPPAPGDCIGFEEVEAGIFGASTQYSPGDQVFSIGELDFYLLEMPTLFWTTLFGDLAVVESDTLINPSSEGQSLFFKAISTGVDFSQYSEPVEKVSIDVRLIEGPVNVSANGGQPLLLLNLSPEKYSIGPEVTLTVKPSNGDSTVNTLIFEGNIKSLLLGGMSMFADNLCINPEDPCLISEVELYPTDCNDQGEFYVNLDFKYEGTADSFYVYQNGDSIGRFNYKWLPVKLGPYKGYNGGEDLSWIIQDAGNPDCAVEAKLKEPVRCPEPCPVSSIEILDANCSEEDGFHLLTFDLSRDTAHSGSFYLLVENGDSLEYNYSDLPVTVKLPNNSDTNDTSYKIKVCDKERDECCLSKTYHVSCGPCVIGDLQLKTVDCDEEGRLYVQLDFDHQGERADSFYVFYRDQNLGTFHYKWLPIKLGPFDNPVPGANGIVLSVVDAENPNCGNKAVLQSYDCPEPCPIRRIHIVDTVCTNEGYHILTFDLDRDTTIEGSFTLYTEDGRTQAFNYQDLPVQVKIPYNEDKNDISYKIKVCANNTGDCCIERSYRLDCRLDCSISKLEVKPGECDENGNFYAYLDFDYENVSDYFVLWQNGNELKKVGYDELPIKLGPFSAYTDEEIYWEIFDSNNPECSGKVRLGPVDCPSSCLIGELVTEAHPCNDDGTFMVDLTFRYRNVSDSFYVLTRQDTLKYGYDELPVTIGPFQGESNAAIPVWVKDAEKDCGNETRIIPVDCDPNCNFQALQAWTSDCDEQGQFYVKFAFRTPSTAEGVYLAFVNGEVFGPFSYAENEQKLGPFKAGTGSDIDLLLIDLFDPTNCNAFIELDPVDCEPGCLISELIVKPVDCTTQGTYIYKVDIWFDGPQDQLIEISTQHQSLGVAPAGDFPMEFEVRLPDAAELPVFYACALNVPDCCIETKAELPDCDNDDDCDLKNLYAEAVDCTPNEIFYIKVHPEFDDTDDDEDDKYDVYFGSRRVGAYAQKEFPVKVGPFDVRPGNGAYVIRVIKAADDTAAQSCRLTTQVKLEGCAPFSCAIEDIRMKVDSCNAAGELYLTIQPVLDADQLNGDEQYGVYVYDRFFGVYSVADFPVSVGPVAPDAGDLSISIDQRGREDCWKRKLFEPPYCEDRCEITAFSAKGLHCNGDGTYTFQVSLKAENPGNDYFDLYGPNGFIGYFKLNDVPVQVDVAAPEGESVIVLEACINDRPNCCERIEVKVPDCLESCPITELSAKADDCLEEEDDDFFFTLDFIPDETVELNDSFYVSGKNEIFGSFAVNQLPVRIGPVSVKGAADDEGTSILLFEIKNLTAGCAYPFRVEIPECPEIKVWPGDANRDRIANHRDIIYIGLGYGERGPQRGSFGAVWEGIPSTPWSRKFQDDINFKHADCNGDGVIDIRDKAVIVRNYGLTSGPLLDRGPLPGTDYDPSIFVDLPEEGELEAGSTFTIPIILGTEDNPVRDIYGFSFSINFDPNFINPEKVQVHYPTSWFGQEDVNVLTLDKIYEEGRIEIGMTRNDQNDVSGYGPVAYIKGIIADIAGIVDTRMETAEPLGISLNAGPVPLNTKSTEIKVASIDDPYTILRSFHMFPMPAGDVLHFSNVLNAPADEVRLFDLQGRQVLQTFNNVHEINISDLPSGMYLIRVKIQGIVINDKLLKR